VAQQTSQTVSSEGHKSALQVSKSANSGRTIIFSAFL